MESTTIAMMKLMKNLEYEFYVDADGDGFGDENEIVAGCDLSIGLSSVSGDCDDNDPTISPAREGICDGIDNDCNDEIDDGVLLTFFTPTVMMMDMETQISHNKLVKLWREWSTMVMIVMISKHWHIQISLKFVMV